MSEIAASRRFPLIRSCDPGPPPRSFHSHRFPDGDEIVGDKGHDLLQAEAEIVFVHPVAGLSLLDVGAWDGFFSFEAERRGAARVLATDHFCWSGPGWGTRRGFEHAHDRLGSSVEALDIDVDRLSPQTTGLFDVVLFLGVLYHLKEPFTGLARAAAVTGARLVIETEVAMEQIQAPVMRFFQGDELNHEASNFWAPNRLCLEAMLRELGFRRFDMIDHPSDPPRGGRGRLFVHAWR